MSRQYVTTAIDFPNAAPHMGHVYEKILADVIVRWFRLRGDEVRFHLGNDENGIKIQQTAKEKGITPRELVNQNAPAFENLFRTLNISFDYFIRTADPKTHWPTVVELWKKLQAANYLEKRTYTGLYCAGCERFWRPQDLVDGKCPDHQVAPQEVTEENWFFLLNKKQKDIVALLGPEKGGYHLIPEWRAKETMTFLEGGLEDVSFSRSTKTLSWGVPVPGDPDQVMYVWCDNLTSYISSLDYFGLSKTWPFDSASLRSGSSDSATQDGTSGPSPQARTMSEAPKRRVEWWDDAEVTHVIGKDIARFHAINWPAMLQVAGVKTPDRLLIHGFLTSDGQKMSKTLGNVVVPGDVLAKYGVDPLRFFLMHEIPVGNDGDFSWKRFGEIYDSKLRNQLGNLLNRVLVLLKKGGGAVAVPDASSPLSATDAERAAEGWADFEKKMNAFDLHAGIQQVLDLVSALNTGFNAAAPWKLEGEARLTMLSRFAESLRHVALLLLPFMPETAQKITQQLNVSYADTMTGREFVITKTMKEWGSEKGWKEVGEPAILFAPVE